MNKLIREFEQQSGLDVYGLGAKKVPWEATLERFTALIVTRVLDEVEQRAYYTGDRNWSNELDRPWVELEFGFGKLTELKNDHPDLLQNSQEE
jgi:hypothetical protein